MSRFLLIRHASHDYLGRRIAGWLPGVHINAQGRGEAERLASALAGTRIDALYSSPLDRTMETAQYIAARVGRPVEVCEDAGEVRFGEWTDADFETLQKDPRWHAYNAFRSGTRAPGGESMLEVQARIVGALERMRSEHPNGTVAVVSHGDVIRSAVMYYLGMPLDLIGRFEISPASVTVVEAADWGARILLMNAVFRDGCGPGF